MPSLQLSDYCEGEGSIAKEQSCTSDLIIWYKFDTDSKDAKYRKCKTKRSRGEYLLQEEAVTLIMNSVFGDVHPCKLKVLSWKLDKNGDYILECQRDYKQKFCQASRPAIPVMPTIEKKNIIKEPPKEQKQRREYKMKRRWRSRSRSPPQRRRRRKRRKRRGRRWG